MTVLIAKTINFIPGLHLRADDEAETLGMDEDQVRTLFAFVPPSCRFADHTFMVVVGGGNQIGEFATDYIEVRRDYTDWTARPNFDSGVAIPMDARPEAHHEHSHPVAAGVRHGKAEVGSSVETVQENEHENNNEKDAHGHGQNGNGNGLVREV